ncbi:response regulator [Methylobacterium nigriterrae]|uniref:response regulator n=1 Tax=Methylobacterium nigriterrae TaxID=3127512 RepID=UPI0030133B66
MILVVEDEVLVRMIATDILVDAGYCVLEARDAEEAVVLLGERTDVDLVVTDFEMPGAIDGLKLAHIIHERLPHVPTLLISGRMRPAAADLPPGGRFLGKPFRSSGLVDAVQKCLGTGDGAM